MNTMKKIVKVTVAVALGLLCCPRAHAQTPTPTAKVRKAWKLAETPTPREVETSESLRLYQACFTFDKARKLGEGPLIEKAVVHISLRYQDQDGNWTYSADGAAKSIDAVYRDDVDIDSFPARTFVDEMSTQDYSDPNGDRLMDWLLNRLYNDGKLPSGQIVERP